MSWTCSNCKKEFAKENQSHKCEVVEIGSLFKEKAELYELYLLLLKHLEGIGTFSETTSSKAITFYTPIKKSFLVVEPKSKYLTVWFVLGRKVEEFPVFKILPTSKTSFAHFVRFYQKEDIDPVVMELIIQSYEFIMKR